MSAAVFGGTRGGAERRTGGDRWNHAARPVGYLAQLYAITGWSSLRWLDRISAPTLVLAGDDDPLVPLRNARLLAARIPYARLDVRRGAGHLWVLDHAAQSAPIVDGFLSEVSQDVRSRT